MKQVGELIQETIEEMESGAIVAAFISVCTALEETLKKALETEHLSGLDYQRFIKENWRLLAFMGLPDALPMPLNVDYKLKTLVRGHTFNGAEDLISYLIKQTATMEMLPAQFRFHAAEVFEVRYEQIYVPSTLIGGLTGLVIFQPVNKGESVPDKYWINVADFKMFISEFWGRIDLAERILKFYR